MRNRVLLLLFFALASALYSQETSYAGIEIGAKGVKVSVIKIADLEFGEFELVKSWTRNTNITQNITKDGTMNKADIDETSYVVLDAINQLKREHKIVPENIFVVASTSVTNAKNAMQLSNKILEISNFNIQFMTSELEAKLIAKGSIPPNNYDNSIVIDVGSGSSKGGFVKVDEKNNDYKFYPFGIKFGAVSLVDKLNKKSKNFNTALTDYQDSLSVMIKNQYSKIPEITNRQNVYVLGGAAWAFITLTKSQKKDAYQAFTYNELIDYRLDVMYRFEKFNTNNYVSRDYEQVLKTFNKETIASGANLLYQLISNLKNPENKKYYFVRQGQLSWLLAYIVDSVRKKNAAQKN